MQGIDLIFTIGVLVFSVILHEISHGYAALAFGDPTARLAGRLTLNPASHLDPVGSLIVPVVTSLAGMTVGWAKPVPYNPALLSNERWGTLVVGAAGVITNLVIALIFALIIRFSGLSITELAATPFYKISVIIVGLNLLLAVFNLIPVPPLDGSKILFAIMPDRMRSFQNALESQWLFLILIILFVAPYIVVPILNVLFNLFTGYPLTLLVAAMPF